MLVNGQFPFVHLRYQPDPDAARLYYGKSYMYPLVAAPFVWLWGTNGFVVLHAILLAALVFAAYLFLAARSPTTVALLAGRRLLPGHGHARLRRLDDAGAVQPGDGDAGVFLLALQGSRAGGAAAWAAVAAHALVRCRRGRAAGDGVVLQAAQRRADRAHRAAGLVAPPLVVGTAASASPSRLLLAGAVHRQPRHHRRPELSRRRAAHVLQRVSVHGPDDGV